MFTFPKSLCQLRTLIKNLCLENVLNITLCSKHTVYFGSRTDEDQIVLGYDTSYILVNGHQGFKELAASIFRIVFLGGSLLGL